MTFLQTIGLTDWSSFFWGAGAMFVLVAIAIGLFTMGCASAPTIEKHKEEIWG